MEKATKAQSGLCSFMTKKCIKFIVKSPFWMIAERRMAISSTLCQKYLDYILNGFIQM